MKHITALTALVLMVIITAALAGCGGQDDDAGGTGEARTPADTVRQYYEALYNNDTQNEEDVRNLTRYIVDEFFSCASVEERTTLEVGLPLVINASSRHGGASVEFTDVEYLTLDQDDETARVRMTGTVRSTLPDGEVQERELDKIYLLVNADGKWKLRSLE